MKISKTLYVTNREQWRDWLKKHHRTETSIWLIYYKKSSGKPRIAYEDAVEEALCFGWIDSTIQKIDEEKFAQRFTPRKNTHNWSELNKRRVKKLIKEGRMTKSGLAKLSDEVFGHEAGAEPERKKREIALPRYFKEALMSNAKAWYNFKRLAPSYRRSYLWWVTTAKREETRSRRIKESIEMLEQNRKLGMK